MLPKHLDEKVAKLHLDKLGVELEELSKEHGNNCLFIIFFFSL